ncbi:hypothetical protein Poli38472_002853 [Pythium oligandrum]|uniref:Uncharacterized protein n=1 Tax=Pythium oligandrum TaxID=41045 RepID=A0A8K1C5S0_PYTOL|nr:hypothetical protein Poli38472_002853 [Pythium oligandrum]|eukprot:TMW56928.1 hypothetical protein Poli38472_002853 [Pythium oligandrum]
MSVASKLYGYARHTVLHLTYAVLRILRLDGLMRLGRSMVTTFKKSQLEDAGAHQTAGEATQHTHTTGVVTHDVFDRKGAIDSSSSTPDLPVSSLSLQKEEESSQDIVRGSEATPIERELESRHTEDEERVAQPVTTTLPVPVDKLGDLVLLHEMSPVKTAQLTVVTHAHQSMSLPDLLKSMEPPKVHNMELISPTMEALNLATMPMKSLSDVGDLIKKKPIGESGDDKDDLEAMRAIERASVESNATEDTEDEHAEGSAGQPVELTTATTTDESAGVPIAERPEDQNDSWRVEKAEEESRRVSDCDDNGREELSTVQALVANAEAAVVAAESAQSKKVETEQKSGSEEVPDLNMTEEKEVIETARALIQEAKACVDATKEAQEELSEMETQQGVVPTPKSQQVSLSDPFEEFSSSDEDLTEVNDTFVSVPPFLPTMMMTIVHSSIQ